MTFFVIDGADGAGKQTQTDLLIEKLSKTSKVEKLDFPQYERESSYFVKRYLNGDYGSENLSPYIASLFYALDRFDTKLDTYKTLSEGTVIVSNRYVSANAGHQGGKIRDIEEREHFIKWLYELEFTVLGLAKPDICFYLDIPPEFGQKLIDKKGHRDYLGGVKRDLHEESAEHLENARESFIHLTTIEPNWIKIDCIADGKLRSIESIHTEIWDYVMQYMIEDVVKEIV